MTAICFFASQRCMHPHPFCFRLHPLPSPRVQIRIVGHSSRPRQTRVASIVGSISFPFLSLPLVHVRLARLFCLPFFVLEFRAIKLHPSASVSLPSTSPSLPLVHFRFARLALTATCISRRCFHYPLPLCSRFSGSFGEARFDDGSSHRFISIIIAWSTRGAFGEDGVDLQNTRRWNPRRFVKEVLNKIATWIKP